MTPERRARIIAGVLIGLAILQLIPALPSIGYVLSEGSQRFWRDFQEAHGR